MIVVFTWTVANPAGAVKVEVHGAFSANLDRPARVRFVVVKAGKPQGCLPASFDFGCRGWCSSGRRLAETYLISMYVSTRGTRDGGLYTCRRSPKTDRLFVRSRSQKPRPFSCRCKRGAKAPHPASPVSRTSRYNTLHFASQSRVPKGACLAFGSVGDGRAPLALIAPLWKPPLPACGPGQGSTAHINPSINLSCHSVYGLTGATNCDTIRA